MELIYLTKQQPILFRAGIRHTIMHYSTKYKEKDLSHACCLFHFVILTCNCGYEKESCRSVKKDRIYMKHKGMDFDSWLNVFDTGLANRKSYGLIIIGLAGSIREPNRFLKYG